VSEKTTTKNKTTTQNHSTLDMYLHDYSYCDITCIYKKN